jgi:hypothetical protein
MNRRVYVLILLLLFSIGARADLVGYGGTHEVTAAKDTLTFRHTHDWDAPEVGKLFFDLTHHERFFSAENNFASVELRQADTVLFRSPSSALTHLWISPDARFFIGLSHIMLRNPYQLVVWQRDGTLLHREHISSEVAKFSPEQRRDFAKRFPKAGRFLSGRYVTHSDSTYLDFSLLGVPNEIGDAAWNYLSPLRVSHPYSDDFRESVTNFVEWFDRERPELSITRKGSDLMLSLRSPTGKRMTIQIKK